MTAQRQERNGWRPGIAFIALFAGIAAIVGPEIAAQASTTERVVVDRTTGLALGGYDPTDAARGVAVAGNPRFWLILGQRLFLFGAAESRDAFAADPARFAREAKRRWPGLKETLAR